MQTTLDGVKTKDKLALEELDKLTREVGLSPSPLLP